MTNPAAFLPRLREQYCATRRSLEFIGNNSPIAFFRIALRSLLWRILRPWRRHILIPWASSGFFSNVRAIVFLIHDAEQRGLQPVMVSSRYAVNGIWPLLVGRNLYWDDAGWNGSRNTWEYYFEPVSGVSSEQELIWVRNARTAYENPHFTVQDPAANLDYQRYGYASARWGRAHIKRDYPSIDDRMMMYTLLTRHVTVRPIIKAKVDAFYAQHMAGRRVVGVHIRKGDYEGTEGLPTHIEEFSAAIDERSDWDLVYLATDCEGTVESMRQIYQERLMCYDCTRGTDTRGIHNRTDAGLSKALLGEETLIDALLLTRCDYYVHGNSSMNFAVLSWNPTLEHLNIFSLRKCQTGPDSDHGEEEITSPEN